MDMTRPSIRPNRGKWSPVFSAVGAGFPSKKLEIVKQTNEPIGSLSLVVRQHGLAAIQLFQLRKAYL